MSIVRYKRGSRVKLWQEIYSVVIRASYFQLLDTSATVASWQRTIELWDNGTDGGRWIQGFEWMYENLSNQWVRLAIVYVPSGYEARPIILTINGDESYIPAEHCLFFKGEMKKGSGVFNGKIFMKPGDRICAVIATSTEPIGDLGRFTFKYNVTYSE